MADFHALCVDLVRVADALDGKTPLTSNQGQALDGYSALIEFRHVADRARAALAQPELQEPTDQEITEWADAAPGVPQEALDPEFCGWRRCFGEKEFADTIRAALAHWA